MASKITGKIIDTFCSFYEKAYFSIRQFYSQHDTKLLQSVIEMNGAKLLQL